ncbi:ABC transporter, ATP-binding protein [Candidatus Thiomargarita nelsonii]|uniref:ABC transporter, ATP-binding protein n=1 Tax=Candidatus Thiomargarita nelsonii TaxID=1003181 RepID=A0A176RSR5_9GAMM|nr:ABC transporter, ATP-binding protein [Candidatus Thiomargarita nelsonii]
MLDEPTNDLDVETLELLEDLLSNYPGTLLLVSHDRHFLNNVVTSTIIFEGNGQIKEYVGGYQDWLRQRTVSHPAPKKPAPPKPRPQKTRKLNYKEQRELADLPERIETLETEQEKLQNLISHPDFYRGDAAQINQSLARLKTLEAELQTAYERWEILEAVNLAG